MAIKTEEFDIRVGPDIIKVFERIDIDTYRIFSEFIDNSYQNFLDNIDVLQNKLHIKTCKVEIKWTNDEIIVKDNSFGMDKDDFGRSLRLNAPKEKYSENSLSKYGMGLKYAASNLGDFYTIRSSAYGSNYEYYGEVDLQDWIERSPDTLIAQTNDEFDINEHGTTIIIKKLKKKFTQKQLEITIIKLGQIYSEFLNENLVIEINNNKVNYMDPQLLQDKYGGEELLNFSDSFMHEGKTFSYTGWIGILNKGSTDGAGFTLYHNNRGIELNYKPKLVFGAGNDFRQQRIVGQIYFDDNWDVRVNKDGLAWQANGLEDIFLEHLSRLNEVVRITKKARQYRVKNSDKRRIKTETSDCEIDISKREYKIGEIVTFTVKPSKGYKINFVKLFNEKLNSIDGNGKSFSFTVNEDMDDPIKIRCVCAIDDSKSSLEKNNNVVVEISPNRPELTPEEKKIEKIKQTFSGLKNIKIIGTEIKKEPNLNPNYKIIIEYSNTKYAFDLEIILDSNELWWYELKEQDPQYENSFLIRLNLKAGFLKDIFITSDIEFLFISLGLSLTLSRLSSVALGLGLDKSRILIDQLNNILREIKS